MSGSATPESRRFRRYSNTTVFALMVGAIWGVSSEVRAQATCSLVPVDGGEVHACVAGAGATVVLASGAGQHSGSWSGIRERLAESRRVVTFDRPGLGRSPAAEGPRSPTRIAAELTQVLDALGVDEPVVLVGHSMGGVHVLRFAAMHPGRVRHVVTIDTPPPGFENDRMRLLSPQEQTERRRLLEEGATRASPVVRREREGAAAPEEWSFPTFDRAVPITVIVADAQNFGTQGSAEAHRSLWIEGQDQWLALSDHSERIIASGRGHMIHVEDPDLVLRTILGIDP